MDRLHRSSECVTYGIVSIMYIAKTVKYFNGLKVKFDNYHQMVKKAFSLRFGFKLKR